MHSNRLFPSFSSYNSFAFSLSLFLFLLRTKIKSFPRLDKSEASTKIFKKKHKEIISGSCNFTLDVPCMSYYYQSVKGTHSHQKGFWHSKKQKEMKVLVMRLTFIHKMNVQAWHTICLWCGLPRFRRFC